MGLLSDQKHAVVHSFILHLAPGVLILLAYIALTPLIIRLGGFPQLSMAISFLLIGVMGNLFFLYYIGRTIEGKYTLKGVVRFKTRLPAWQVVTIIIGLSLYIFPMAQLMSPVSSELFEWFDQFLPHWFMNPYDYQYYQVAPFVIGFTLIIWLLIDGLLHPVVEELYFRGYLLPRLSHFGWMAPVINACFFSLFHLWQPHNIPSIFVTVLPWYFIIHWKKDVSLSILIHVIGNTMGATFSLVEYFSR